MMQKMNPKLMKGLIQMNETAIRMAPKAIMICLSRLEFAALTRMIPPQIKLPR